MDPRLFEEPIDYIPNGDGTAKPVYAANKLRIQFVRESTVDTAETLRTGKEVVKETIVLLKQAPKDTNIVASRATAQDKAQYADAWRKFEKGQTGDLGTSLGELYGMTGQALSQFTYYQVYTIEQLAKASEEIIGAVDGGLKLRELAQIWVDSRNSEKSAKSAIVIAEVYKKQSEELARENEELRTLLAQVKTKKGKKNEII